MATTQQTGVNAPTKSSIYDYDARIARTMKLIQNETSPKNQEIIQKYDDLMLCASMAKATRHKHMQTILNLTRFLNKDWNVATANDIGNLVVEIVRRYANDNGQETYTSYDHKKILKIFFRWIKLGSREFREVGDPIETKSIRIKTPSDRLSREDLITDDELVDFLSPYSSKRNMSKTNAVFIGYDSILMNEKKPEFESSLCDYLQKEYQKKHSKLYDTVNKSIESNSADNNRTTTFYILPLKSVGEFRTKFLEELAR